MYLRVLSSLIASVLFLSPAVLPAPQPVDSNRGDHGGHSSNAPFTYAVYGDAPYGTSPTDTSETDATPAFIAAVNADPLVSGVVHVGDIHSGSQYCTQPYDAQIYQLWTAFADPMVFTPGDNEWTDCHKVAEGGGVYNPTTEPSTTCSGPTVTGRLRQRQPGRESQSRAIDLLRRAWSDPRSGSLKVTSQATSYDRRHPEDGHSSKTSGGPRTTSCSSRSTCRAARTTSMTLGTGCPLRRLSRRGPA